MARRKRLRGKVSWNNPELLDPARPPRTVRPRERPAEYLPLIAVGRDGILAEGHDPAPRSDLPATLRDHPGALVVCEQPESLLAELHHHFRGDPAWNWRLTPIRQTSFRDLDRGERRRFDQLVNLFGWRAPGHRR